MYFLSTRKFMVFRYIPEAYEINMVISIKLYCVIAIE